MTHRSGNKMQNSQFKNSLFNSISKNSSKSRNSKNTLEWSTDENSRPTGREMTELLGQIQNIQSRSLERMRVNGDNNHTFYRSSVEDYISRNFDPKTSKTAIEGKENTFKSEIGQKLAKHANVKKSKKSKKKKKDTYIEYNKLPLSLKKQLTVFMLKNNVEFEKDFKPKNGNQQTMVAKLEIVGTGGKKAKVKLTEADIERLCRTTHSHDSCHNECKREEWLEKRKAIDRVPKMK